MCHFCESLARTGKILHVDRVGHYCPKRFCGRFLSLEQFRQHCRDRFLYRVVGFPTTRSQGLPLSAFAAFPAYGRSNSCAICDASPAFSTHSYLKSGPWATLPELHFSYVAVNAALGALPAMLPKPLPGLSSRHCPHNRPTSPFIWSTDGFPLHCIRGHTARRAARHGLLLVRQQINLLAELVRQIV